MHAYIYNLTFGASVNAITFDPYSNNDRDPFIIRCKGHCCKEMAPSSRVHHVARLSSDVIKKKTRHRRLYDNYHYQMICELKTRNKTRESDHK